ncbi:MAG: efflux RND transporter permease subunit [Planctomycetota bacterium]|jgi:HAE1 family hydrophobic/amphiphilic exporter-1
MKGTGGSLARFSVRQGVLVNILFGVCLLAGYYGARRIAVDAYPNVDLDAAAIYTVWIGASPAEIDNLVTARIEDELEGIRGIDRIVSDSRPNRSSILVKFRETLTDREVDRAFQDIRAALERIDDLPEEAERPVLQRQTVFEIFPLVSVAVGYARPELEPVARAVARELRENLLEIDGVGKVDDRDLREPEYTVRVDRHRLERYDVTLEEVVALLEATNRNVPAGELHHGDGGEFGIKAAGNYLTARDLEETVIRQDPEGAHVLVRDVAGVVPGFEERDVFSRFNGRDAVILPVSKEEGRNSLELVDTLRADLDAFRARGLPAGIEVGIALDSSQIIRDRFKILLSNLGTGMVLVFLALWMGIGIRNAVLAIIGVPFCYLVAILFLGAIDVSLNAISLFAMVLVSGVIVDDALIVLENTYRHLEEKRPLREAVIQGAAEVFWPVMSSTLTTLSAFLPMLIMVGVTGEFFAIIPKVITVALLASLFECFVVLPVHYLHFGQRLRKEKPHFTRPGLLFRGFERLRVHYRVALDVCLRHRYATVVWLLAAAIVAVTLWGTLDTVLFPSDFQVFLVNMEMPTEASLEQTAEAAAAVDELLHAVNREGPFRGQIEAWTTTLGAMFTEDNYVLLGPHVAQAFVSLKQGTGVDPIEVRDYASALLERVRREPRGADEQRIASGLKRFAKVSAVPQADGPPTGKPVAVRIRCDDLDEAEAVATRIKAFLRTLPGVIDIADNHDEGRVEYSLALREELAAAQGITFGRAARTLVAANEGLVVSVFKDPGGLDDADVRVRLDASDLGSVADLGRVRIRNAAGVTVPLSSIARITGERSHAGIYRYDGRRTVVVNADVQETVTNATAVNEALRQRFDTPEFRAAHPAVGLRFGGEFEETRKSFASLGEAFKVAVLAIYMILAAQFRSYALPLVILLTVPFAFIGVVVGLFVTGNPFTIMAGIAMVGLAGIAVNDAIVLVDFIHNRRREGMALLEAVHAGCHLRARPIMLTSVTTIAGLLPMALGLTGFSKLWSPFAATICFGILFSTLLTLLVIPAGYVIVEDLKARLARRRAAVSP